MVLVNIGNGLDPTSLLNFDFNLHRQDLRSPSIWSSNSHVAAPEAQKRLGNLRDLRSPPTFLFQHRQTRDAS